MTTPENFYTSIPPTQTMAMSAVGPGGSFFVVTAVYGNGESGPSNEAGAGTPGAVLQSVKIKGSKLTADGTGFTATVQVFVDGIPFATSAKVKRNNTRVVQKGNLLTGQSLSDYLKSRTMAELTFLDSDQGLTQYAYSVRAK
jgi:hypothetical protein